MQMRIYRLELSTNVDIKRVLLELFDFDSSNSFTSSENYEPDKRSCCDTVKKMHGGEIDE